MIMQSFKHRGADCFQRGFGDVSNRSNHELNKTVALGMGRFSIKRPYTLQIVQLAITYIENDLLNEQALPLYWLCSLRKRSAPPAGGALPDPKGRGVCLREFHFVT